MESTSYDVIDSRDVRWTSRLSGPTRAGTLQPGELIDSLPEIYFLRFHRVGDAEHEIVVDLRAADVSADEAKVLLEQQPEWIYEGWARP